MGIRGRNREVLGQMKLSGAEFIEPTVLSDLEHVLRVRGKPVRDKITWKYDFEPTPDGARHYVEGCIANLYAGKSAVGAVAARELIGKRNRNKWHVVAGTQQAMWLGATIAKHHLTNVEVMRASVDNRFVFADRNVQVYAANAVWDFGASLAGDPERPAESITYPTDIGADIAHIGEELSERPELFLAQSALLGIVAEEQHRRIAFFQPRLDALKTVYGVKLSQQDLAAEHDLSALLGMTARQ